MFKHLFINKLKKLLRNKPVLFWTLAFPFVMATLFHLVLGNISNATNFEAIEVAVINNEYYQKQENLKTMIESISKEGDNQVFKTQFVDKEKAEELLKNDKISGYIIVNEEKNTNVIVKSNGINQTIIKNVIDEYYQISSAVEKAITYNPEIIYNGVLDLVNEQKEYIKDNSNEKVNFSLNYFFTLIAMTCLYGSLFGLEIVKDNEANLSKKGARVSVSPVSKIKVILVECLASLLIQVIEVALLFMLLIFGFNIDFGNQILWISILSLFGCIAGTMFGVFVGASNKKSEGAKIGILTGSTMLCCFLAGMMGSIEIKSFFDAKFPFLAMINPINIITDGLYALYAYSNLDVYFIKLGSIVIFSLIMILLSIKFIRRKKYDSI